MEISCTYAKLLEATRHEWGPQHEVYMDHCRSCSDCYPPAGRYCAAGLALRDQYDVAYMSATWTPGQIARALDENPDLERLRIPLREAVRARQRSRYDG